MRFRPEVSMPWQALAGLAAVVYVVRSAMRGWDFVPSVTDLLVFGGLALILLARPLAARWLGPAEEDDARDSD